MNTPTTVLLMNGREAAIALRVSYRSFCRLISDKRLRSVRIGRRRMFDPADLRAFIEACKD